MGSAVNISLPFYCITGGPTIIVMRTKYGVETWEYMFWGQSRVLINVMCPPVRVLSATQDNRCTWHQVSDVGVYISIRNGPYIYVR